MIIAMFCTTWLNDRDDWCAARAMWLRYGEDGQAIVSVVCPQHRRPGDLPIPGDAVRSDNRAFWRERDQARHLSARR